MNCDHKIMVSSDIPAKKKIYKPLQNVDTSQLAIVKCKGWQFFVSGQVTTQIGLGHIQLAGQSSSGPTRPKADLSAMCS